jgi:hypothetical protein
MGNLHQINLTSLTRETCKREIVLKETNQEIKNRIIWLIKMQLQCKFHRPTEPTMMVIKAKGIIHQDNQLVIDRKQIQEIIWSSLATLKLNEKQWINIII